MQQPIQIEAGSGLFEPGLICTMTQVHLVQIETIWRGMLQATQQPDKDWNWGYKLRLAARESRFEAYVVEIDKLAHGVVLLETEWHHSQLDNQGVSRSPLVYVE